MQTARVQFGHHVKDHFGEVARMVSLGAGANREIADVRPLRSACYFVAQNGDPAKPVIAQGQSYVASQTRRQELTDRHFSKSLRTRGFDFEKSSIAMKWSSLRQAGGWANPEVQAIE